MQSAPDEATTLGAFTALPPALTMHVFAHVPADTRLRCLELSRGFHALLADRSLWTRLQLPQSACVARTTTADALLHAAARRAGGALEVLDLTSCKGISRAALLAVVAANAGTLRELRISGCFHCSVEPETSIAESACPRW